MRTQYPVAHLKTLLDMGRKYMADRLQKLVRRHLRELFPSSRAQAQASYSTLRPPDRNGDVRFDPWVAIDIAIQHDLPLILPMALYYSTLRRDLEEILNLKISPSAIRILLLFRDSFIAEVNDSAPDGEGYFDVESPCVHHKAGCVGIQLFMQEKAVRYYRDLEGDVFQRTHAEVDPESFYDDLCANCLKSATTVQKEFTDTLWFQLPDMCKGVPGTGPWRVMQADADAEET